MRRSKLDRIDKTILRNLQDNGRITNVELANRAGISAPPCLRRVRALEEQGYIRGYHADLDGELLGFDITVFAFVGLVSQAESDLVHFEEMAMHWPLVRECHMLQGDTDFLLKVVARDLESYNRFLTSELTAAPNVANVRSAMGIRTSKREYGVPVNPDEPLGPSD